MTTEMNKTFLYKSYPVMWTPDEMLQLLEKGILHAAAERQIRRYLKDRLEGLDEMVKSEVLHDKIVSA